MADYTSVLTRAVAGKATYEERRAVYERARQALVAQLRALDPPLPESDITRQRLALEEAIRKVETEASGMSPAGKVPSAQSAPVAPPEPAVVAEAPTPPPAVAVSPPATEAPPPPPKPVPAPEPSLPSISAVPLPSVSAPLAEISRQAQTLGTASERAAKSAREQLQTQLPAAAPEPQPAPLPVNEAPGAASTTGAQKAGDPALTRVRALPGTIYQEPSDTRRGLAAVLVVLVLLVASGIGIWMFADRIFPAHDTQQATSQGGGSAFQPGKVTERVGADSARPGQTPPAAAVQAQAFLYEDNTDASRVIGGLRGRVVWRIDTDTNRQGQGPERVIRGLVEIPERNLRLLISIRRNIDAALPASHTIELLFETPPDWIHGSIDGVPGFLMKPSEQAQGIQLAGPTVRITSGYFLTGLSALATAREQNVVLLRDRPWMDIPVVYRNGRLAVLTIEKGPTGEQVFQEAFRSWGN